VIKEEPTVEEENGVGLWPHLLNPSRCLGASEDECYAPLMRRQLLQPNIGLLAIRRVKPNAVLSEFGRKLPLALQAVGFSL
jgi:hypothetical protein